MKKILNFINGEFVEPQRGVFLDGINPAADKVIYQLANSDASDVAQAVNAAHIAYRDWQQTTVETRVNYLNQFANLILEHAEELAQLESQDTGKPLSLAAQIDIPRSAKNFHYFAQAVSQFQEQAYHTDEHSLNYTLHQSLGVVACISPWNLPLYLLTWKIAPALAMGNCIVAKPSELTPLTANKLAELSIQAGLPAGVLNIIHGEGHGAGQALCENEQVAAVSFTGGTKTGRQLAKTVAPQFKKLSLELGGKNAAIIFNDCDFDKMLETVVRSCFANQGEICLCSSRVLVERALYDRFLDEFIPRVKQLKIGDPNEPNTKIGALISKSHQQKVLSYIDLARSEGGQVLCGGQAWGEGGCYVEPTVITGLTADARCNQEEIFGPMVTVMPFDDINEAITIANGTDYGLAASIWTRDLSRAHQLGRAIESGIVWINCWMQRDLRTPFGGMKQSGVGREGGYHALEFFSEVKNICLDYHV